MTRLRCVDLAKAGRLEGVSLDFTPGEVTVLVGPSGAGKSTLLWLLAGLERPDRGRVERGAESDPDSGPAPAVAFQGGALWDHLTVEKHLAVVGADAARARELLDRTGLAGLARRRPPQLSGGERQRLELARALAAGVPWLLLDEPTAHLDGPARADMVTLLGDTLGVIGREGGAVVATHHADVALPLADRIVVMIDGRVVQSGPPQDVYRRPISLAAARLLGPADVLPAGVSIAGFVATPNPDGEVIVRPDDLVFVPDASGSACVRASAYHGTGFRLTVELGGHRVDVRHPQGVTPGTAGRLSGNPAAQ